MKVMKKDTILMSLLMMMGLTTISANAETGEKLNIKVFVNNVEVKTPVYENPSAPPIKGDDFYSVYVDLVAVFEKLEAKVKLDGHDTAYITGEKIGNLKIIAGKSVYGYFDPSFTGEYRDYGGLAQSIEIKDGVLFIVLSSARYLIGGSLKQDKTTVYLYSRDFERLDIPGTLEESFKALDSVLSEKEKNQLKETSEDDLIKYHRSLGAWIRNNWIYPSSTRIARLFLKRGINHPDDISFKIIQMYHSYLHHQAIHWE